MAHKYLNQVDTVLVSKEPSSSVILERRQTSHNGATRTQCLLLFSLIVIIHTSSRHKAPLTDKCDFIVYFELCLGLHLPLRTKQNKKVPQTVSVGHVVQAGKSGPTSVEVPRAQVRVGYVFQLLRLALMELLDVAMLVTDHGLQDLDLCFQEDHLLLTWHRGLDRERRD